MATPDHPGHLPPSELGTKAYWDSLYSTELSNHASNPSDTGTVWFDDSDAEAKITSYLLDLTTEPLDQSAVAAAALSQENTSFLDLGCGNGSLLFALRAEGWSGRMLGVDYSHQSVALARQISLKSEDVEANDGGGGSVEFSQWDILNADYAAVLSGPQREGWDVVLDKGTFDAISLSDEKDTRGRRLCEGYRERVLRLVRRGGLFVVTSCNWTEAELRGWFEERDDDGGLAVVGKVDYPTFSFGGVKGQTISTLCFQRT